MARIGIHFGDAGRRSASARPGPSALWTIRDPAGKQASSATRVTR
jgi:hypothetical protein